MDIIDGMQQGYLAEVDYRMLTDGIDWDEIALMSQQGMTIKDLNMKLIMPDRDLAVVEKFAEHFKSLDKPRALVFCRSIEHANRMRGLLAYAGSEQRYYTASFHANKGSSISLHSGRA